MTHVTHWHTISMNSDTPKHPPCHWIHSSVAPRQLVFNIISLRFNHRRLSGWLDLFQRILLQESIFLWFMEWWPRDLRYTGSKSSKYPQPRRKRIHSESTRWTALLVGPVWYQLWRNICVERWNTFWLSLLGETPAKQLSQWRLCSHSWVPSRPQVRVERCELHRLPRIHLPERLG